MLRLFLCFCLLIVLGGCTQSRYSISQDVAPTGNFDADQVPDAIPKWEPRSPKGNLSPYTVRGVTYTLLETIEGYEEIGVASWYGLKFHGELTSNGEVYNMYDMSAAHKTLPLPAYLRVTNLENDKSIVVRVNDRGPFHEGRIIDLSYAAAKKLGFQKKGTAKVKLQALTVPKLTESGQKLNDSLAFYIQLAASKNRSSIEALSQRVKKLKTSTASFISETANKVYRLRLGPFENASDAELVKKRLIQNNIGSPLIIQRSMAAPGS